MNPLPWIRLLAYQDRRRSTDVRRAVEPDADLALRIGLRVVGQLRAAIACEIARTANVSNQDARIDDRPLFSFQVVMSGADRPSRTLAIALTGRTVSCSYRVVGADGAVVRREQWLTCVADPRALVVWQSGIPTRLDGIQALATYLIAAIDAADADLTRTASHRPATGAKP